MWKATVVACFNVPVVSRNSKVLKENRQPLDTWKLNQGEESSEQQFLWTVFCKFTSWMVLVYA